MNVLHLNCNGARTGRAKAADRLHAVLPEVGIDSHVLLGGTRDQSSREVHVSCSRVWRAADEAARMTADQAGPHAVIRPSFRLWRRAINVLGRDVVHIHWTYSSGTPPLVNTGCERWLSGCGSCSVLAAGKESSAMLPMLSALTAAQWKMKRWDFPSVPSTVVASSPWMADLVLRSPIMSGATVECVPNPLDTAVFAPRDGAAVRERFGLPLSVKVVFCIGKPNGVLAKGVAKRPVLACAPVNRFSVEEATSMDCVDRESAVEWAHHRGIRS